MNQPLTTVAGLVGVICTLGDAINLYFDGNPATLPNWMEVGAQLSVSLGLIFACDAPRKSKDAKGEAP